MPIYQTMCGNCRALVTLHEPAELEDVVPCPKCEIYFTVQNSIEVAVPVPSSKPILAKPDPASLAEKSVFDFSDDNKRPRKKKRRKSDDHRPRKKKARILASNRDLDDLEKYSYSGDTPNETARYFFGVAVLFMIGFGIGLYKFWLRSQR